jgi:hypothetical protein
MEKRIKSWAPVLSLVILATQETEIGRVMVLKSARAQSS